MGCKFKNCQFIYLLILFLSLIHGKKYVIKKEILLKDRGTRGETNNLDNNHLRDESSPEITWEKIPSEETGFYASVLTSSNSQTFVIFSYNSNDDIKNWSTVYVTRDLGKTVSKISLFFEEKPAVIDEVYVNKDTIIAVDRKEYSFFSSNNGGKSFNSFSSGYSSIEKVVFHPTKKNYIAAISLGSARLLISKDDGISWNLYDSGVHNFKWSPRSTYYYYLTSFITSDGPFTFYRGDATIPFQYENLMQKVESLDSTDDLVYLTKFEGEMLTLYISYEDGPFKRTEFPYYLQPTGYEVRHSTKNDVFVMVRNASQHIYLYSGLLIDLRFTRLVEIEEYQFTESHGFLCNDVKIFKNVPGLIIGNIKTEHVPEKIHPSMISYTHGVHWVHVNPPLTPETPECKWPLCYFAIEQSCYEMYNEGLVTVKNAPHLILTHGMVQNNNATGSLGFYLSTDAGTSWSEIRKGRHIFTVLDDGGVIVAYPEQTNSIYYSYNEGREWSFDNIGVSSFFAQVAYHDFHGTATASVAFGFDPDDGTLIIVRSDFSKVLKKECTPEDYVDYTPGSETRDHCFQGKKNAFKRRKHEALCLSIFDKLNTSSETDCPCSNDDFGCYFGYYMNEGRCVEDPDSKKNESKVCIPGSFHFKDSKKAKLLGDTCISSNESQITTGICGLEEESDSIIVRVGNTFRIVTIANGVPSDLINIPIKSDKSSSVGSFAVDIGGSCLYFSSSGEIRTICWGTRSDAEIDVSRNFIYDKDIHSVQIDHVARNIFFLDSNGINIISIDGRHRKLIVQSKNKINFYKVFPTSGVLLYSEIIGKSNETVLLADMTGKVSDNFTVDGIVLSASDSLDHSSYDIYTKNLRYTYKIQDKESKKEAHGITNLISVEVKDGKTCILTKSEIKYGEHEIKHPQMNEMHLYSHSDIKKNPCSKSRCEYICVPEITGSYACLCPDSMELVNNSKCVCDSSHPNCTECGSFEFQCSNKKCVNIHARCNGVKDCDDGSDEEGCVYQCSSDEFMCGDKTTCINIQFLCDGVKNCKDGFDEKDCKIPHQCKDDEFKCENNICIPSSRLCDGQNNCGDFSDEENCENEKCKSFEFGCRSGGCVPLSVVCDGKFDCRDWSDEENCYPPDKNDTKPDTCKIECDNKCIPKSKICDHITDCSDKSDELNCGHEVKCTRKSDYLCPKQTLCYSESDVCDGVDFCMDGADEASCPVDVLCKHPHNFHCRTTDHCIHTSEYCNGVMDCDDGSDEESSCLKTARVIRLNADKITFSSIRLTWKVFLRPVSPIYRLTVIPWKHNKTSKIEMNVTEENQVISDLFPCSAYIAYVIMEGTKIGAKYDFVTHNSETEVPLELAYTPKNSILSWKYNSYECRPTVFYVNCNNKGEITFHNFTSKTYMSIPVESTTTCQVSACPTNVFNISCGDYSSSVKVSTISKTNKSIGISIIVLAVIFGICAASYFGYKFIIKKRIQFGIPTRLRNLFRTKSSVDAYDTIGSRGNLLGGDDEDDDSLNEF